MFGAIQDHMADLLRDDLKLAGVTRAELYERSEVRMPIRAHDLRSTFVTLSLAAGRSETWVSDRTGHRSTQMISRYRRAARTADELEIGELARTASELGLGELVSMVETVPDLPDCGPGGGPEGWAKTPATSERNITIPALFGCTPGRTRTCDQWIRNPPLYPTELRAHDADGCELARKQRGRPG